VKKWIGLDPSIAAFGYAVLTRVDPTTKPVLVTIGTMTTKRLKHLGKWEERAARMSELGADLAALFDEHPDATQVYIEQPVFPPQNGKVALHVAGRVRGLAEGLCAARRLPLVEVPPQELKRAVAGAPGASKEDVARVVRAYYGTAARSLDATDALAVAHVGAFAHGAGAVISSGVVRYNPPAGDDDELD